MKILEINKPAKLLAKANEIVPIRAMINKYPITFFVQWIIGLIIDFSRNLGATITMSYQISFSIFLFLCILSYLFFLILNKNE